jgi:hypothetical protein
MNYAKWIHYFSHNERNRPEPDWSAPLAIDPKQFGPLVRSLEQFRLGDGGGPASLIAYDAEGFRSSTAEMRTIVDAWFREEAGHARLLGCAVKRFGGRHITAHWSFTAFCLCRHLTCVRFELQVLLLTELVSTAYYRMLRKYSPDAPLAAMCELILRDEAGHVVFHRDRLAGAGGRRRGWRGLVWAAQFQLFGYAAATMLWVNHGPCLRSLGCSRTEYFLDVTRQLRRFIFSLRRAAAPVPIAPQWASNTSPDKPAAPHNAPALHTA